MASIPMDPRAMARIGIHSPQAMQRRFDRTVAKRWTKQERFLAALADDDIFSDRMSKLMILCGVSLKEQELRDAIQNYISLMAFRVKQGHTVTYDETYAAINQIAEDHGYLSGVPVPILGEHPPDLVMAPGVPLAEIFHMNQEHRRFERMTEMARDLDLNSIPVRNSWHTLGDQEVCIIDTEQGPLAYTRYDAGLRLRKLCYGIEVRHHAHQTAEAELRAQESLRTRISKSQFNSYVLSGAFPERSERSDIWYYFRKGLPTLAVTFHGERYQNSGRVLAALCLHPMGYYRGTHVGLMCPSDEVIAHLLMMRTDEHYFWRKSGQWSASDTRSGI